MNSTSSGESANKQPPGLDFVTSSIAVVGSVTLSLLAGAGVVKALPEFLDNKVCDHTALKGEKQDARNCLKDRSGQIALVGFGIEPKLLNQVAHDGEVALRTSSGGLIDVKFIQMQVPEEASALLDVTVLKNEKHCIEEQMLAKRAESILGLKDYTAVVAVTRFRSCAPLGGHALGRHADIYGINDPNKAGYYSYNLAHEVGHLFGLGHYTAKNCDTIPIEVNHKKIGHDSKVETYLDVEAFLGYCELEEYEMGSTKEIMNAQIAYNDSQSINSDPSKAELNAVQREQLRWPEVALGQNPKGHQITKEWAAINDSAAANGEFSFLNLDRPVKIMQTADGVKVQRQFDQVAFIPSSEVYEPSNGQYYVAPAIMYLIDSQSKAILHTWTNESVGYGTYDFGKQRIETSTDSNGLFKVRVTQK